MFGRLCPIKIDAAKLVQSLRRIFVNSKRITSITTDRT